MRWPLPIRPAPPRHERRPICRTDDGLASIGRSASGRPRVGVPWSPWTISIGSPTAPRGPGRRRAHRCRRVGRERAAHLPRPRRLVARPRSAAPRDARGLRRRPGAGQRVVRRAPPRRDRGATQPRARRVGGRWSGTSPGLGDASCSSPRTWTASTSAPGAERWSSSTATITVWRDHRSGRRVRPPATPFPSHPPPGPDGGLLRPDVVWFGEALPSAALASADAALASCDLFFAVGTSAVVYPAAGLIERAAARGARCVEVNPEPSAANLHTRLVGRAGDLLPRLVARAFGAGARPSPSAERT